MSDLVTFILAQLDADEAAAREAGSRSHAWDENGTWHLEGVEHDVVGDEEAFCHPHNAAHIARHDPARVLAEVAAKREVVAKAQRAQAAFEQMVNPASSAAVFAMTEVLRALASVYEGAPGWQEEWR